MSVEDVPPRWSWKVDKQDRRWQARVGKARPMLKVVEGPLSSFVPGSALQLHGHATVFVDEAAASKLKLADYYKYTYANKPAWQHDP